jgi:type II secretory pathway predicted ATPase ExeA
MAGYRQLFNLTAPAFGKAVARQHLLVYPQLAELETDLEELLTEGGIGLLTGEMGIGKTTALRHFLGGMDERACQVAYQGSTRHATALLESLVESLGVTPARHRAMLLRQLGTLCARTWQEQRKRTLVVLDDAHLLDDALLEDFRLLTNFEMDAADPLIVLLVGHPALRRRLRKPVHLAMLDRVRMQYRLEGLSRDETAEYLDHHMRQAGGKGEVFTAEGKAAIFDHAQGIPRRINTLALACLKKAVTRKLHAVDAELVAAVESQLSKD